LGLGVGELSGLLVVVDPRAALAVLAALVQGGVPHSAAHVAELLALRGLCGGEFQAVLAAREHGTPPSLDVLLVLDVLADHTPAFSGCCWTACRNAPTFTTFAFARESNAVSGRLHGFCRSIFPNWPAAIRACFFSSSLASSPTVGTRPASRPSWDTTTHSSSERSATASRTFCW